LALTSHLRFGAIEGHLSSASTSTISKRLDEFEDAGLISRTQYNEIPPRVEYSLTGDGDDVRTRLEPPLGVGLDGRVTAVDILPRVNTRESHGTSPESESCTSLTTTTRSAR